MKILVLTNLYPPHHAGTYDFRCQNLTEALRLRGHTIHVLTSKHGMTHEQRGGDIERRLLLNGIFDHPPVTRFSELRALELANHQMLRETLEQSQPDLVHVFSLAGLSKSLIFTLRHSRRPTVYDVADDWLASGLREDPWLRWWNRPSAAPLTAVQRCLLEALGQRNKLDALAPTRMIRGYERVPQVYGDDAALDAVEPNSIGAFHFDRLYFCSQSLKQAAERAGFRVNHAEVVYPGVATQNYVSEIKPPSTPITKFLIVTRLGAHSGVLTALKALKRLHERNPKMTLSICGKGESDYIAEVRSFVVTHQLPVEFLSVSNAVKDLPGLYRRHDALLHTTEWDEPFSVTPLEAMASGLAVIGATAGGAQELLRHSENALTYPPGDDAALAARVEEILRQPALRCQMAEAAQQEVLAQYNEATVTDRVENYLQTSLEVWAHTAA